MKTLFFSVGEPSGDLHGANLMDALRAQSPSLNFVGFGGPRMREAGLASHADLTTLAVMWVSQVVCRLPRFLGLLRQADAYFREHRPDAVILIDYPGFNWWVARRAKAHGIPVYYYGVPQMWAWAPWRVKKLRRLVDHVLCKLPFEPQWFAERGCQAHFVGHPYFDELEQRVLDDAFLAELREPDRPLVTILPGSRDQEVTANLPVFLNAAEQLHATHPQVRFAIASFHAKQAVAARQQVEQSSLKMPVHVGRTPELIEAAHICLACSGSVSLELLYHETPSIVGYHVGRLGNFLQQRLRTARYITLVNLLATDHWERRWEGHDTESPLFPEFLGHAFPAQGMAAQMRTWLDDADSHAAVRWELARLRQKFAHAGASSTAATYILEQFEKTTFCNARAG